MSPETWVFVKVVISAISYIYCKVMTSVSSVHCKAVTPVSYHRLSMYRSQIDLTEIDLRSI